jgi:hypothetical protein
MRLCVVKLFTRFIGRTARVGLGCALAMGLCAAQPAWAVYCRATAVGGLERGKDGVLYFGAFLDHTQDVPANGCLCSTGASAWFTVAANNPALKEAFAGLLLQKVNATGFYINNPSGCTADSIQF